MEKSKILGRGKHDVGSREHPGVDLLRQRTVRPAKAIPGLGFDRMTTGVHVFSSRATRVVPGKTLHQGTSANLNNRLEYDHRGIEISCST